MSVSLCFIRGAVGAGLARPTVFAMLRVLWAGDHAATADVAIAVLILVKILYILAKVCKIS